MLRKLLLCFGLDLLCQGRPMYCQGFFVTVRAGTAYRHLFSREEKNFNVYYQRKVICVPAPFLKCE